MAKLSVKNINTAWLKDITIEFASGELTVITGAADCGMSALLRAAAGTEKVASGEIYFGDQNVTKIAAKKRSAVITAREFDLSPRMTVLKCMMADAKRLGAKDAEDRARKAAGKLGIEGILNSKLCDISAAQLKLAVIGRAAACDAGVYLFDEPFAGLDAETAEKVCGIISNIANEKNAAVVAAVADAEKAVSVGARTIVMANGKVLQDGAAGDICVSPANAAVAAMNMNIIRAKLTPRDGRMFVVSGETALRVPDLTVKKLKSDIYIGKEVFVGIRPVNISADAEFVAENPGSCLDAVVAGVVNTAAGCVLKLKVNGIGDTVKAFVADCRAAAGDEIKVAVEANKLYLFDAATGENILF